MCLNASREELISKVSSEVNGRAATKSCSVLDLVTPSLRRVGVICIAVVCVTRSGLAQTYCSSSTPCVTTYHNNNNRDGVNPNETTLKASTSNLISGLTEKDLNLDGLIYAQPLYIHQLGGSSKWSGNKDVVLVATENNSVYIVDASSDTILVGPVSLDLNPTGKTEHAVPYTDLPSSCNNIVPEVGITGTPVLDISQTPPIMWLVSKHEDKDSGGAKSYVQKLHGLKTTDLTEVTGSPLTINATGFDANVQNQRGALTLFDSPAGTANVIVTWGSHCDSGSYSGIVMEFDYTYSSGTFNGTTDVFNTQAGTGGSQGGIWMAGGGPAASSGSIFFSTGNGANGTNNYGDSVVKLTGELAYSASYTPNDYSDLSNGGGPVNCGPTNPTFCPSDQLTLPTGDWDLGSGGVVLLSPNPSLSSPEMVAAGKQGMLYVLKQALAGAAIDGSTVGSFACDLTNASVAQCFQAIALPSGLANAPDYGDRATPAFWGASAENLLFIAGISDVLNAYQLSTSGTSAGTFNTSPSWASTQTWGSLGASPVVTWSSSGSASDAIVWLLDNHKYGSIVGGTTHAAGPTQLFAYKAASSGSAVSPNSSTSATSTTMPGAVKFTLPTVVDGRVIIGGGAPGYTPTSSTCPAPWQTGGTFQCGQLTILQ